MNQTMRRMLLVATPLLGTIVIIIILFCGGPTLPNCLLPLNGNNF